MNLKGTQTIATINKDNEAHGLIISLEKSATRVGLSLSNNGEKIMPINLIQKVGKYVGHGLYVSVSRYHPSFAALSISRRM